jgi:Rrf2 family transcriptional regulator, nitric oxide-sensitive transcriptional repressor
VELTFYTDYSLRVLVYLGVRPNRLCLISEIARDYGISRNHLVKVVHGLARGGFVHTYRGRGGGVTLGRKSAEIRIGDVVRHTEGPIRAVECFRDRNACVITPACTLPAVLNEAFAGFLSVLDRYTLADLLGRSQELDRLLAAAGRSPVSRGAYRRSTRLRRTATKRAGGRRG